MGREIRRVPPGWEHPQRELTKLVSAVIDYHFAHHVTDYGTPQDPDRCEEMCRLASSLASDQDRRTPTRTEGAG